MQALNEPNTLSKYLREMGRIPLLTAAEEEQLTKEYYQYQLLLDIKNAAIKDDNSNIFGCDRLIEHIHRQRLSLSNKDRSILAEWAKLSRLAESDLIQTIVVGQRAKEKIITANLRLVVSIAKRFSDRGIEFIDLIQDGNIGLDIAIKKFQPQKGHKFSTYATWWIRHAVSKAVHDKSRSIRLPVHLIESLSLIGKTRQRLALLHQKQPTDREIAQAIGYKPKKMAELMNVNRATSISLDINIGSEKDIRLGDLLPSERITPEDALLQQEKILTLHELLSNLDDEEQKVIKIRYGIDCDRQKTHAKASQCLNLPEEKVRDIQKQAMIKLRAIAKNDLGTRDLLRS